MSNPTFTTPPKAPTRSDSSAFYSRAEASVAYWATLVAEMRAAVEWISGSIDSVIFNAAEADAAASSALSSLDAIRLFLNASQWSNGATYQIGDLVFSPADALVYRCMVSIVSTADPALDPANWQIVRDNVAFDLAVTTGISLANLQLEQLRQADAIRAAQGAL